MKLQTKPVCAAFAGLGILALGACTASAQTGTEPAARSIDAGPAADYPVVIGEPFEVDGVTHTPVDTMNYDQVGYVTADGEIDGGYTGAHLTLPLPSYVEVTSLDTGKTILIRLERRGPMRNDRLIALAPAALAQLGATDGTPIRMRRVNPPEQDRAELRAGREAPLRMETPEGLLEVLRKRLPEQGSASLGDPRQAEISGTTPETNAMPTLDPDTQIAAVDTPDADETDVTPPDTNRPTLPVAFDGGPERAPVMVETADDGKFVVQLGAFSVQSNADTLAREVQGFVKPSGNLSLVRVGPFATRGQAEQALALLRRRGYKDALIQTLD